MPETKIVCFGPGPKFKGGIANYNLSLAKTLAGQANTEVHIISWTQQYPAIVPREFIDKRSKKTFLENENISVEYLTNYNNPFSWKKTVKAIQKIAPDIIIVQWYNAQQGLPLRYITKSLAKISHAEIIFDLHFVVPKEKSSIDRWFTRLGLKSINNFITHANTTSQELMNLFPSKVFSINKNGKREASKNNITELYHPVYNLFQPDPDFSVSEFKKQMHLNKHVFLFFGFIRKYKGLHHAIDAFKILADRRDDVSLLICGESFWNTLDQNKISTRLKNVFFSLAKKLFLPKSDDEQNYRPLSKIEEYGLHNKCMLVNEFIPNEDVHKYFQVSDAVLLFYERATPSGVESLSYNFKMPILATAVGHFPETIEDGFNGYLAETGNPEAMAAIMEKQISNPISRDNVAKSSEKMSWQNYAKAILIPYF